MAQESEDCPGKNSASNEQDRVIAERVQEITWALLDEHATQDDVALLENLLLSDDKARESYIGCVQLHADLMAHFAAPATAAGSIGRSAPAVLGFLNAEMPPLSVQSPSAGEATP